MPAEDVSDLRDVVDAINRLCETMKSSVYEETDYEECADAAWNAEEQEIVQSDDVAGDELVSPEEVAVREVETHLAERWCEPSEGEAAASDTEHTAVFCEPISEMYYTASSEVSLLSDAEPADALDGCGAAGTREERRVVTAGHVAAMRERFESMTRANTPCPELARSLSPSLDAFISTAPSPDRLDPASTRTINPL